MKKYITFNILITMILFMFIQNGIAEVQPISDPIKSSPSSTYISSKSPSLMQIEINEAADEFNTSVDELKKSIDQNLRSRFDQCMKVFGNIKYCKCINDKLAIGLSFFEYVEILLFNQEDINKIVYQSKDPNIKSQIEKARAIRDTCIN